MQTNRNSLESPQDEVLQADLNSIIESNFDISSMQNSTVFVTGATGLIGSQIIKALACYNRLKNSNIKIVASVRSAEKAEKVYGELLQSGEIVLCLGDINKPISFDENIDYIIHGASATSSRYFVTNPVETITTAIYGTQNILEFAREKSVKAMVYLSSLEVYGTPETGELIGEDDYGYIDPLNVRSSYSEGKRMVECLCVSYGQQYGVPIKIARLSQTFGAGVEYDDGRVFAEFARCAIEKRDIVLHTSGATVRSYCYTSDAVLAILYILTKGEKNQAYNVTNMDTLISIKEMAELVCETFKETDIKVEIDIPEDLASFGFNPEMLIKLDSTKLMNLGWKPIYRLDEMFRRVVASMAK